MKITGKETHNDVSQGLKNYDNRWLVGKTEFKKTNDQNDLTVLTVV